MKPKRGRPPSTVTGRGARIRKARGERSVESCAEEIGVAANVWYDWELGRTVPSAGNLLKVARLLKREAEWIEFGKGLAH